MLEEGPCSNEHGLDFLKKAVAPILSTEIFLTLAEANKAAAKEQCRPAFRKPLRRLYRFFGCPPGLRAAKAGNPAL